VFDRSRTDNVERNVVAVRVTLSDDQELTGKIHVPGGRNLFETLNGQSHFIEFESLEGERSYLAKGALRSIQILAVPRAVQLTAAPAGDAAVDPYTILGVAVDSDWETIRQRYLALAKTYHPDRFANIDLPPEVCEYLSAKTRRVNAAFSMLESSRQVATRRASGPPAVYGLRRADAR